MSAQENTRKNHRSSEKIVSFPCSRIAAQTTCRIRTRWIKIEPKFSGGQRGEYCGHVQVHVGDQNQPYGTEADPQALQDAPQRA